jgi:hypothetical protein
MQNVYKFCSRRWGSSLSDCARLTVRSSPHRQERKFSGVCVCRVTFKHLPQPLRSHLLSFGTLGQLFKIPPFSSQKSHRIIVLVGILILLLLRSPCKIAKTLQQTLLWELAMSPEEERKRTNAIYSGHLCLCQQPRAVHALRSDQFFKSTDFQIAATYRELDATSYWNGLLTCSQEL